MDASRFDRISKLFAQRFRPRRALTQEATPVSATEPARAPELLFVQSFRAGAITAKEGTDGRYTLSLEAGTGQTIYFSDRPDRRVGASPTQQVLDRLGFPADNPPNAALVIETAPGGADVAVVELFSPVYDETSGGVTYEVAPLANWQAELEVGLQEAPTDLATLASSFGTAHLFIDGLWDCPNGAIICSEGTRAVGTIPGSWFDNFCSSNFKIPGKDEQPSFCVPCATPKSVLTDDRGRTGDLMNVWSFWRQRCQEMFPECRTNCQPFGWCEKDPYRQFPCLAFPWS